MVLKDFAAVLADTTRSKAYLQMMVKNDLLPALCLIFSDTVESLWLAQKQIVNENNTAETITYFDRSESLISTVEKANIPYKIINDGDINSEKMATTISQLSQKYLIYSGYGGGILKPHLLNIGKKIIHIHAGLLPQYRGSTTVYYSYLQEKVFGATAIFFNEGIDTGEIIVQESFPAPTDGVDIDYIYEPYIRSQVLKRVLELYIKSSSLNSKKQKQDDGEIYYIIHPVLKHLALLSIEKQRNQGALSCVSPTATA